MGVAGWTFLEYILHRFLGHWKQGKNGFTQEHLRHHRTVDYFAPAYKKALAAVVVVGASSTLFSFLFGLTLGLAFSIGLSSMYIAYEVVHRRCHTHAPKGFYGRWVRKHHFYHHFESPKMNHGVTSPIWDLVFGTHRSVAQIKVPRKLATDWMLATENDLQANWRNDYLLKTPRAA